MEMKNISKPHIMFDCQARADPITGVIPNINVPSDFRHAYNIMGIMSINPTHVPLFFTIGEDNGCAASFMVLLILALDNGFFARGDILVLDNSAVHSGQESSH